MMVMIIRMIVLTVKIVMSCEGGSIDNDSDDNGTIIIQNKTDCLCYEKKKEKKKDDYT